MVTKSEFSYSLYHVKYSRQLMRGNAMESARNWQKVHPKLFGSQLPSSTYMYRSEFVPGYLDDNCRECEHEMPLKWEKIQRLGERRQFWWKQTRCMTQTSTNLRHSIIIAYWILGWMKPRTSFFSVTGDWLRSVIRLRVLSTTSGEVQGDGTSSTRGM